MVLAMTAMLFITALGVVLVLTTSSETIIAAAFRTSEAARYAAEAAAERVLADLSLAGDWNAFVDGSLRSTFVDGAPGGARTLGWIQSILDPPANHPDVRQAWQVGTSAYCSRSQRR